MPSVAIVYQEASRLDGKHLVEREEGRIALPPADAADQVREERVGLVLHDHGAGLAAQRCGLAELRVRVPEVVNQQEHPRPGTTELLGEILEIESEASA